MKLTDLRRKISEVIENNGDLEVVGVSEFDNVLLVDFGRSAEAIIIETPSGEDALVFAFFLTSEDYVLETNSIRNRTKVTVH